MVARHLDLNGPTGETTDKVELRRGWFPRRVQTYARTALELMTGRDFNANQFKKWWVRNAQGRQCLWYWQWRLHRELEEVAAIPIPPWNPMPGGKSYNDWSRKYRRQQRERRTAVIRSVGKELSKLSAEVEAKVRLLAINRRSSSLGVSLDAPLMGPYESSRLPADRLLDLLDKKNLWEDVDWQAQEGVTGYNVMVTQLAGAADRFFRPEHVQRLQAVQAREPDLWWNAKAALYIGISKLLPPAETNNLDHANTRDAVLRDAIRNHPDVFVRGTVARELIRVNLTPNWDFLMQCFFSEGPQQGIPDLRGSILQALGTPPLGKEKRDALAKLLLDPRSDALWTKQSKRMGDDMFRQYAIQAVNAFANEEALTRQHFQDLGNTSRAQTTLKEVRRIAREVLKVGGEEW
jgi:hypothetical protein